MKLLLVIDMQNDFVTGVLGSADAAAVVEPIRARLEAYRKAGDPVLFTMDTHLEGDYVGGNLPVEARRIPKHCIRGSEGWEIVPELGPYASERIEKPTFLSRTLAGEIKARWGEAVELELCGVCTDICVVSNALELRAAFPRAVIRVAADCCAGTTPENHGAALAVMKSCLVEVTS